MRKRILIISMLLVTVITIFMGIKTQAMKAEQPVISGLPITKVAKWPVWAEHYEDLWVNCVGDYSKDGDILSSWNPQKTVLFQISMGKDRFVLSVTKDGKTWEMLSNPLDLGFGMYPVWNFNGTAFAVEQITMINVDEEVEGNIYIVMVNGEGKPSLKLVAKDVFGSQLSWSYSGDKLVFANYEEIYIYSLKDSKLAQIAKGYGPRAGYPATSSTFTWSPDDNQIVLSYWERPQLDVPEYYLISNVNSVFP